MSKFNDIKIPENIDDVTKGAIKRGVDYKNRRKYKKLMIASLLTMTIGVGVIGIMNPSIAGSVPIIQNIFEDLSNNLGFGQKYTPYVQGVGQSQSVNGVTVTIEESVSDGHNLYLTYVIKSEDKLPKSDFKPYGETSGDFMMYSDIEIGQGGSIAGGKSLSGYFKDDYTFVGMESHKIDFKGKKAPNIYDVNIKINHIGDVDMEIDEMIKGPFKFLFSVNSKADVKVIDVNQSEGNFSVSDVEITPYSININYTLPKSFASDKEDLIKSAVIVDPNGEEWGAKNYTKSGIKDDKTRVKNGVIYDSILFDYNEWGYKEVPEYLIIKFKDSKQPQEKQNIQTNEDGSVTEWTLPAPEEIKETKDIEFKIDLNSN